MSYIPKKMRKTAGEVRFIKDNNNDGSQWGWSGMPPSQRTLIEDHDFNHRASKDLAKVLRATLASLGHAMSAYTIFTKLKSRDVSPDGSLGGKGYIQEIKHMRKQYMNIVEALSAMTDTLYDEINAPHWSQKSRDTETIVEQAEAIKDDPEQWADEQNEQLDDVAQIQNQVGDPDSQPLPPKIEWKWSESTNRAVPTVAPPMKRTASLRQRRRVWY